MKELKPAWFIQHPIDHEHKQYILLNFLQSVNIDIKKDDIYHPIKKILTIINEISIAKKFIKDGMKRIDVKQPTRTNSILNKIKEIQLSQDEKIEINTIINSSLDILYKYVELGMDLWKNAEDRIHRFELDNTITSEKSLDFGFLVFRNMVNDKILTYFWQNGNFGIDAIGTIMKKISISNPHFSLSYDFIAHELIQAMNINGKISPRVTIIEIAEDFKEDSVIIKIAKEIFINEMSYNKEMEK